MIKEHTLKNKIHKRTKSSRCPTRNTMPIISHWSCALIFLKNPSRAHLIIAQNSSPLWNEIRWLQAEALAISVLNHVQVSSFDSEVVAIKNLIDTDRTMSSRLWSPKVSSQKSLWRCIEWELAELSRFSTYTNHWQNFGWLGDTFTIWFANTSPTVPWPWPWLL